MNYNDSEYVSFNDIKLLTYGLTQHVTMCIKFYTY